MSDLVPTHVRCRRVIDDDRQVVLQFGNGWGVSVITGRGTFGGNEGQYELAVLRFGIESDTFDLVGDDVIGWLTEEQVIDLIQKIAVMPGAHRPLEDNT